MDEIYLSSIVSVCKGRDVVLGPFVDRSGATGLAVLIYQDCYFVANTDDVVFKDFLARIYSAASRLICYDSRDIISFGVDCPVLYDVKLLYGGEHKMFKLAEINIGADSARELSEKEKRLSAHLRVCRTAKVDLTRYSLLSLMPDSFVTSLFKIRGQVAYQLFLRKSEMGELTSYANELWPFARTLYQIEANAIHVDVSAAKEMNKKSGPVHESRYISGIAQSRDGYVRTRFNPCGGKTGRIKIQDGFNCMGIPHGQVRNLIDSRFVGGQIFAFDYNAIDYRCIVSSVDDMGFRKLYDGINDFHAQTMELIGGSRLGLSRDVVKALSYVYIYGGSPETLAEKSGKSLFEIRDIVAMMKERMGPIDRLRDLLVLEARRDGYVLLPTGKKIPISGDDHEGKVIGLYAQSYSSEVFRRALMAVQQYMVDKQSKVIFTVHDELVIDLHPEETVVPIVVHKIMEDVMGDQKFKVNIKKGRTYGDATD